MDALAGRLAPLYYVLVGLGGLLPTVRLRALAGAGLALLGLAAAADRVVAGGTDAGFRTINELLALAGGLVVLAALGSWYRSHRPNSSRAQRRAPVAARRRAPVDLLLLAGLVIAALAPHLLLLGLGAMLALASGVRTTLRARRPGALVPLLAGAACLAAALTLMLSLSGPLGGVLAALPDGPFSLAASRLLTLWLGAALLLFAGLPPFDGIPARRALAPLSAVLLIRLVVPAFPEALLTWQLPAMLILAAGLAWSALRRRWPQAAVAGGLMALWSGVDGSLLPGSVLVGWGWVVETGAAVATGRGLTLRARWAGLVALPAGFAALPALAAGLGAQVLLTVVATAACVGGMALQWKRGTPARDAPLY